MIFPFFVPSYEREEFYKQLDFIVQSIYDAQYITLSIKIHGQHETEYSLVILENSNW
jgi:hypothetical protein